MTRTRISDVLQSLADMWISLVMEDPRYVIYAV